MTRTLLLVFIWYFVVQAGCAESTIAGLDRQFYIDKTGQETSSPESFHQERMQAWEQLWDKRKASQLCSDGTCDVLDNGNTKNIAMPPGCLAVSKFCEGVAAVAIGGRFERPYEHSAAEIMVGSKLGFVNCEGKMVIPAKFSVPALGPAAIFFQDGLAAVPIDQNGCLIWGFINHSGKFVIAPRFKAAECFYRGRAPVVSGDLHFNKALWLAEGTDGAPRRQLFEQVIREHGLVGMDESRLVDLLGPPQKQEAGEWWLSKIYTYSLGGVGFCALAYRSVQIEIKNSKVWRYRETKTGDRVDWLYNDPKFSLPQEFQLDYIRKRQPVSKFTKSPPI